MEMDQSRVGGGGGLGFRAWGDLGSRVYGLPLLVRISPEPSTTDHDRTSQNCRNKLGWARTQ